MIVNKYKNGGGSGSGGTYVLPPATENTLGGIKVGDGLNIDSAGTLSASGGSVPDMNILRSVDDLPESANTGDVVAHAEEITYTCTDWQENEEIPYEYSTHLDFVDWGIEDVIELHPFTTLTFPEDDYGNNVRLEFYYTPTDGYRLDVWKDGGGSFGWDLNDYADGEGTGDTINTIYEGNNYEVTIDLTHEVGYGYYLKVHAEAENQSDPCAYDFTFNNDLTYIDTGLYQYDGEDWSRIGEGGGDEPASQDFIHLDSLSEAGEEGKTYEYQGRLMTWNPNSGNTAEWLKPIGNAGDNEGTGLIFANIPDGQKLFDFKYTYGGDWRSVVYSGGTLYYTETAGTVVCAVTVGNTFTFEADSQPLARRIYGVYKNGYLGFRKTGGLSFQNVWDGKVNNGHYELLDKYNYPYMGEEAGIPVWNEQGQVIRKSSDVSTKNYFYNTTGTSVGSRTTVLTIGVNNGPDRMFVPTQPGTAGQILQSNGNAEPTWVSMVKIAKVTSAEYEALVSGGTVDSNTLYLIDNGS